MFKKALSGTVLTLFLIGILAFNIKPVRADEIIYIRPDGTVDPSTAPIQRVGNVYTFTDDIYNMSIEVQRDYITLDGDGHVLQCFREFKNFFAIYLYFGTGVTLTNIVISDGFIYGILLDYSYNNKIINNTLVGDINCAIKLLNSDENSLLYNKVVNACDAIWLESSNYNTLTGNEVRENTWGISLDCSIGNTLRRNVMAGNKHHFDVWGFYYLDYWLHSVDSRNTVDGKPIYYWINRYNETVPSDAGCVVIVNSSRITVKNIKFRNNSASVSLAFTTNSLIENITATADWAPIYLHSSDHNIITKNNFTANAGPGIGLDISYYNNITYNTVLYSNTSGIWLEDTAYNTLIGNTVAYCRHIWGAQEFDGSGILVDDSPGCKLVNNTVMGNKYGITLGATPAQHNIVVGNNIVMNDVGLVLYDAKYNGIFHNNFLENKLQVQTFYSTVGVTFDDGYPSGGNYWSDYAGVDLYSGPCQNETGSDGFGDTPYMIGEKQDNYPLMQPHRGSVWNLNTGQNYPTIQRAINNADENDRMLALSRTYYENVVLNKSVTLIGEDRDATIIDGNGAGSVVTINRNNVNISCFTIQKSGTGVQNAGIYLNNTEYCSITENNITNNDCGLLFYSSSNNVLYGNSLKGNNWHGVRLCCSSSNNSISENDITNNYCGIYLSESSNNSISGNNMANNSTGITLEKSLHNSIVGNNITGNNRYGVLIEFSSSNSMIGNYIVSNSEVGIWFNNSNRNVMIGNTIAGSWNGIFLVDSSSNFVGSNVVANCESEGILIDRSANNTLDNNVVAKNVFGVWLAWFSENNTIINNAITNNQWGGIGLHGANRNMISYNDVSGNGYGIDARGSSNNMIFHNNFINNTSQVYLEDSFNNTWDNTCEGNYWSNYNGTDSDADGIGDTYLPWEGVDYYPLMSFYWNPSDVDHDLDVDLYDAVRLLTAYGSELGNEGYNCHCDIAEPYGVIDLYDAVLLLVNYGEKYS